MFKEGGNTAKDEFTDFEMMLERCVGDTGSDGVECGRFDDFERGSFTFSRDDWFGRWLRYRLRVLRTKVFI
jgi:hypothetical protein